MNPKKIEIVDKSLADNVVNEYFREHTGYLRRSTINNEATDMGEKTKVAVRHIQGTNTVAQIVI